MTNERNEWASHADELAGATEEMLNRTGCCGGYRMKRGKVCPTTRKRHDYDWLPMPEALRAHFRGERSIGLHTTTRDNQSRWLAFDIDNHGPEDDIVAEDNRLLAELIAHRLLARGLTAYIFDSNGKGGFHVWAVLSEPMPSEDAYELAHEIANGLDVEAFPKQPRIREGGYGNWIRLPGKHYKRDHWSRLWTDHGWATAKETVAAVIEMARIAFGQEVTS